MRSVDKVSSDITETKRLKGWRRNTPQWSKKSVLIAILTLILLVSTLLGASFRWYTITYRNDLALAEVGMQHLQMAEEHFVMLVNNPLAAQDVAKSQQDFAEALTDFTQIDNDLHPVLSVASAFPVHGNRFYAVLHLVPLAIAISQAGVTSCDILNLLIAKLHDPLSQQSYGITAADINFVANAFHDIRSSLTVVLNEADQLQPTDLQFVPGVSKVVSAIRRDGPMLQGWFDGIEKLLPVVAAVLGVGTPANYLVELLDSTELRPGGGFIGNYGMLTLSGGLLASASINDTYLLDYPFEAAGFGIPFPPEYRWFDIAKGNWGLRDSNLDADFPTAARAAELLYEHEGGNGSLQGVIAITPTFIERALSITGPIIVPEYQETVNAQNLVASIHYHQLGLDEPSASPDGHSSLRKRFTELLAEHFLARVRQLASSDISQFFQLMVNAVRSKDLQIYFNQPQAEMLLSKAHLDAAIQAPSGDDLFVVDANVAVNKANSCIKSTLNDQVTVDAEGNAVHHATLHYAWITQGEGCGLYRDYVRVYVPEGSILQAQDGWQQRGIEKSFGHEVWAGFFTLPEGQTNTVTLTWYVPHAATYAAHGWHYQEMIQKQSGTNWTLNVQVVLPSCATQVQTTNGMVSMGKNTVVLNQTLTENTHIATDYVC